MAKANLENNKKTDTDDDDAWDAEDELYEREQAFVKRTEEYDECLNEC